jgi:hypothetical protein
MGVMVSILQAGQLLVAFLVSSVELALKIKSHFELDPAFTVNVSTLEGDALSSDQATMDSVNTWRTSVGLTPLVPSAPPPMAAGGA